MAHGTTGASDAPAAKRSFKTDIIFALSLFDSISALLDRNPVITGQRNCASIPRDIFGQNEHCRTVSNAVRGLFSMEISLGKATQKGARMSTKASPLRDAQVL